MLVIRLSRVGKRNTPQYKIVVAEKSAPIKGRFVEQLGSYNPHMKVANLNKERIQHWISVGAQCTDTTHNLLVKEGVIAGPKRMVKIKQKLKEEGQEDGKVEQNTTTPKTQTEGVEISAAKVEGAGAGAGEAKVPEVQGAKPKVQEPQKEQPKQKQPAKKEERPENDQAKEENSKVSTKEEDQIEQPQAAKALIGNENSQTTKEAVKPEQAKEGITSKQETQP